MANGVACAGKEMESIVSRKPAAGGRANLQSERELMRQVVAGDDGAFTSVYRSQSALLFSVIFHILRDQKEAEDVLQESFVQLWRKASSYDADRSSISTRSITIARRKAIDKLRSRRRYFRATEAAAAENILGFEGHAQEETDRRILREDDRNRIEDAMREIGDPQREAISLAFFSGLTHAQIAERVRAPLGTVKARIRRGMFTLRKVLRSAR